MEMRNRLEELATEQEDSLPLRSRQPLTECQRLIKALGVASRKKPDIVRFCTEILNLKMTGNETIAQLQSLGIRRIHSITEPSDHDLLGFGNHSTLEYIECHELHPDYCSWVMTTAKESVEDASPQLQRFARWLNAQTGSGRPRPSRPSTLTSLPKN